MKLGDNDYSLRMQHKNQITRSSTKCSHPAIPWVARTLSKVQLTFVACNREALSNRPNVLSSLDKVINSGSSFDETISASGSPLPLSVCPNAREDKAEEAGIPIHCFKMALDDVKILQTAQVTPSSNLSHFCVEF